MKRPKLLFFVTEDWYFCSHRLPLAVAAQKDGFEVVLVTRVQYHRSFIEAAGIRIIALELNRGGLNPWQEGRMLWKLRKIYHEEQPDILHHVAIKPIFYGSLVAWFMGFKTQINSLTGLGWIYASRKILPRFLALCLSNLLRLLLKRGRVIVQNSDDYRFMQNLGIPNATLRLIRGSGVDLQKFHPNIAQNRELPVVMLVSRMLRDKGICEFVEAAEILHQQGLKGRFILIGDQDQSNRASLKESELMAWQEAGVVEWWGQRDDIAACFVKADIACLPSYREGLPKSLLEAAACGLPIVTTDVPGCREVVKHSDNGLLVPVRNSLALAKALRSLLENPTLRHRMGQRSRERVELEFSVEQVVQQTLAVYKELLT